jgi:hypothetical protein
MIPCRWLNSSAAQMSAMISSARTAVDELHDDVRQQLTGRAALLAGVVDRDDRGVVERRGVLRLTTEPQLEVVVPGQIRTQHLDRDIPAEPEVTSPVYLGHAAVPQQLANLVPLAQ